MLVQSSSKITSGWKPIITLLLLHVSISQTEFQIETFAMMLDAIRKDNFMFSIDIKCVYFQIPLCLEAGVYFRVILCFIRGVPVQDDILWSFTVHQIFFMVFHSRFGMGPQEDLSSF